MKQGEIWMVNFSPSQGHEYKSKRPAIIISSNKINKISKLITIMPITSNIDNFYDDDIKILKDNQNKLFIDSVIKVNHIYTFDKNNERFCKKIGEANEYIIDQIKKYLLRHFEINGN